MKKYHLIALFTVTTILAACNSGQKVEVVKAPQTSSTIMPSTAMEQQNLPTTIPNNVTAICRDGSYSTATDTTACLGNGGVATQINRYYSE